MKSTISYTPIIYYSAITGNVNPLLPKAALSSISISDSSSSDEESCFDEDGANFRIIACISSGFLAVQALRPFGIFGKETSSHDDIWIVVVEAIYFVHLFAEKKFPPTNVIPANLSDVIPNASLEAIDLIKVVLCDLSHNCYQECDGRLLRMTLVMDKPKGLCLKELSVVTPNVGEWMWALYMLPRTRQYPGVNQGCNKEEGSLEQVNVQNKFDLVDIIEENEHSGINQHNGEVGITKENEGNNAEPDDQEQTSREIDTGADEVVKNTADNVDQTDKSDDLKTSKWIDDDIIYIMDGNVDQTNKSSGLQDSKEVNEDVADRAEKSEDEEDHIVDEATESEKVQEKHDGVVNNNEETLIEHEVSQKGVSSRNEEVQQSKTSSGTTVNQEIRLFLIKQTVDPNITTGAMITINTNAEIRSMTVVRKNIPNKVLHATSTEENVG
ncbi:hypothetical protein RND71_042419 [Anisodus tanguticus]|uniref:Uncharacterized protein n=1 Tax=Anisodus tanguticus TaxID=243964 RepID=A0AAE1QTD7_9SOLA|nr:hypothetical protein RND71_042419 [Anisodus tanguticus]